MKDVSNLVGYAFPGGEYTIAPHRHWLACDAIGADPRAAAASGVAFPLFAYYAAIGGMGLSLEQFFELCGCGPDMAQPMLGETTLDIERPLRIGQTYRVSGRIEDVRRRTGSRVAVMDLITAAFVIADADGACAHCAIVFVFPRSMS